MVVGDAHHAKATVRRGTRPGVLPVVPPTPPTHLAWRGSNALSGETVIADRQAHRQTDKRTVCII